MITLQRRSTLVLGMLAVLLLISAFVVESRGDGARAEAIVTAQEDGYTHALHYRWTLLPWLSANVATEDSLGDAGLLGVVTVVWGWDNEAQSWHAFFADSIDVPGANDLLELRWGQAYWIAINDEAGAIWPVSTADGAPPAAPTAEPVPTPEVCPDPSPLPVGANEYTSISVDLTGDGLDDELATYRLGTADHWRLRITFGAGGGFDEAILLNGLFEARPVSGFDVNGDGRKEAFVTVGLGITQIWHGLYVIQDCTAIRVTEGGVAASFPVGAGVMQGWMLQCRPPGLWAALIEVGGDPNQTAPRPFEVWRQPYTLEGTALIAGEREHLTGDEAEAAAREPLFDCGVEFGAPP